MTRLLGLHAESGLKVAIARPLVIPYAQTMLPAISEEVPAMADSIEKPGAPADSGAAVLQVSDADCRVEELHVSPAKLRACVMRWNGQWIPGDRFARDYASGVTRFDAEVSQAVARFLPLRNSSVSPDLETHAAVWAAVLVAFEAASFRDSERKMLHAAVIRELRPTWSRNEKSRRIRAPAVLRRAAEYFALRDADGQLATAGRIVNCFLGSVGLAESARFPVLSGHLCAIFGSRILRDIYLLSAASKLRTAVSSLVEGRRLVQTRQS